MTALEFKTKARALVEVESGKELFEIALYAADEKSPTTEDGSCRGSGESKEDHFGTYELISLSNDKVLARTRLGKSFRFREDSVEGATVLSLTKPDKSFVVISQYGSCMSTAYYFYRMDSSGKFHSIKFIAKSKRYDSINGKGLDVIGDKIVAFIFDRSVTDGTSREFYKFDGRNMVLSETIPGWGEDN